MTKVQGKKYAYKFDFEGLMTACQQMQNQGSSSATNHSTNVLNYHRVIDYGNFYENPTVSSSSSTLIPTSLFSTTHAYWPTSPSRFSASLYSLHATTASGFPPSAEN